MLAVPIKLPKIANSKKLYTIHQDTNKAFMLQIFNPKTELYKSTLVAFKHKEECIKTALTLETHKKINNEYPVLHSNANNYLQLYGNSHNFNILNELEIKSWTNNELVTYSIKNCLDILYINEINTTHDISFKFKGSIHKLDADIEFYMNIFENLYRK